MSVAFADGVIRLDGDCTVEDAETLLLLLQQEASAAVDAAGCRRLHTAVMQVLLASARPVLGRPDDPFVRNFLLPQFVNDPE